MDFDWDSNHRRILCGGRGKNEGYDLNIQSPWSSHRKRIIELLGERGKGGFKELLEDLNISVGALYHHIEV